MYTIKIGLLVLFASSIWASPLKQLERRDDASDVVGLINTERINAGCGPLSVDGRLQNAAQDFSQDMANRNYFSHNTPEGVDPGQRMRNAGYDMSTWGENIFMSGGLATAQEAVNAWMNSEGHRANILNCGFAQTGVGIATNSNGASYWTQDFATPL
jgi:uncharacterized protein YkwD